MRKLINLRSIRTARTVLSSFHIVIINSNDQWCSVQKSRPMCTYIRRRWIYLLFILRSSAHSPQMSNFPESREFRGHPSGETEAVVVYVQPCRACGYFGFGRGGRDQDEVLYVLAEVVCDLHLPLNQPFSRVKGEHHRHILANDGDGVRFLV